MTTAFHIIIPARLHSTRLPGKLLMDIHGKSVLERVYQQAVRAKPESIIIAADGEEIAQHARKFANEVVLTDPNHATGSDRIAEVVATKKFDKNAIIVNVQGDEPFIDARLIQQVANLLVTHSAPVSTLCWPIESLEQFLNPNVVKVVRDSRNYALYFSRSPIPLCRDNKENFDNAYRHIGLYAYRANFLLDYVGWPGCALEQAEALEMLRMMWRGYKIVVEQAQVLPAQDINTIDDLLSARQLSAAHANDIL